jgi:hypothetical protein
LTSLTIWSRARSSESRGSGVAAGAAVRLAPAVGEVTGEPDAEVLGEESGAAIEGPSDAVEIG